MSINHLELIQDLGMKTYGLQGQLQRKGLYKCYCGNEFETWTGAVKSGKSKSCGCLKIKHGKSDTKEYLCWKEMKKRCYNSKNKDYENYGGRGISVCDRWIDSFEHFLEDMGDCPEGYSIDRIDVNGNYEPSNCKWSNNSEQGFNKRISKKNTSGCPGVRFNPASEKYQAYIKKDKKFIHLGSFLDLEEAVKARKKAEIFYFGKLKINSVCS